ncbi:MAG: AAA family ATPase [Gemmatimonadetes bacterium]|nr:AAA family ATPase [Gemmatimonadota bacterium]
MLQPLELVCFGPPTVRLAGQAPPTDVLWRKNQALLVYLALSPDQTRTREHLIGMLWPEKDQTRARRSFNEAVRRLRMSLGDERLTSRSASVTLNPSDLHVDAVAFETAAPQEKLAMLRGDFLEGHVVDDAPEFERWVSSQRVRFRGLRIDMLIEVAESALERSDFRAVTDAARSALDIEPYSERAVRLLMQSAALAGDGAHALKTFNEFKAQVELELGESASRELTDLHDRIRTERWRRLAPRSNGAADPPLVGREDLHGTVFGECRQGLSSGPRVVVITGDQGLGRTRLLEECLDRLALDGAVTARASPLENDHDTPWSTLRLLLRQGLDKAPGVRGAAPEMLGVLTAIEPTFAANCTPVPPQDASQVAAALAACLAAIAEEQPVALAVDDADLADGPTIATLRSALQQLPITPVVLLLTSNASERDVSQELLAVRAELGRRLLGVSVQLTPLRVEDIEVLIDDLAPWCTDSEQKNRLARRLFFETDGLPLYVVTLLRALQDASQLRDDLLVWPVARATMSTPYPIVVPDVLCSAVMIKIGQLATPTAEVLKTASVLGHVVDPGLVAETTDIPELEVKKHLIDLERVRFLAHHNSRFAFAAPLVAHVIRKQILGKGERRDILDRALEALETRPDSALRVTRARLLAEVGRKDEALELATQVAKEALDEGCARTARRSLRIAARVSDTTQLALLRELELRLAAQERSRTEASDQQ